MVDFNDHLLHVSVANRSLKWLYLHSRPSNRARSLKDRPSDDQLFQWLLDVSRCETLLLNLYKTTLDNRESEANGEKLKICEHLKQLADFFEHGFVKISETQKVNFIGWIRNLIETVEKMDVNESEEGAATVQQIMRRMKQASEGLF
uniref:Uncharacterized protein n=1 Tax=Caenorhabditis japonica TaxID=281687 RepID=A0A8R1IHA0_CAEJA